MNDYYPGDDLESPDRDDHYDVAEERLSRANDRVYDTLASSADNVFSTVLDWADEIKVAQTFKAFIVAYENSQNAGTKENREQSQQDFIVFAKSFAAVCMTAIEDEAEHYA